MRFVSDIPTIVVSFAVGKPLWYVKLFLLFGGTVGGSGKWVKLFNQNYLVGVFI